MRRTVRAAPAAAVVRAVDKLAASTTARQRRQARATLRVVVSRLLREHPLLNPDGTARQARTPLLCPLCRIPMHSYAALKRHLDYGMHKISGLWTATWSEAQLAAWQRKGVLQERVVAAATAAAFTPSDIRQVRP